MGMRTICHASRRSLERERAWSQTKGDKGTNGALLMGMGKGGTHFWLADGWSLGRFWRMKTCRRKEADVFSGSEQETEYQRYHSLDIRS